jgi:hypothetical protein
MEDKSDVTVIAIKTTSGEDLLGFYAGEIVLDYSDEKALMIYRPIKIDLLSTYHDDGVSSNYYPKFYFPYGEVLTPIPYRTIAHQELANPFFARMYHKFLGEMIVFEEKRQAKISKAYDLLEFKEAMKDTDSSFINVESDYLQ